MLSALWVLLQVLLSSASAAGVQHYRTGIRRFSGGHSVQGSCKCHRDPILQEEVICACRGPGVNDFKANLTGGVTKLSLESLSITALKSDDLKDFKDSLKDLIMDRVKELSEIENTAFHELRLLRTISIKQAPKLKHINDEVFNCHLPNLKIVRIIQSGLESVPNLQFLDTKSIIYMVDLDSNKITNLPKGAVKMKSEVLNLDFNIINEIDQKAFFGSEIAKLSLKGNVHLHTIHESAFLGLKNIRYLDLSETSISTLPIKGLEDIEILKLSEVYSLKVFPSVFHFKYIKEAYLTYPYHCCAFEFPATHDPEEFSKYLIFREQMEKTYCNHNAIVTTPFSATGGGDNADHKYQASSAFSRHVFNMYNNQSSLDTRGRHRKRKRDNIRKVVTGKERLDRWTIVDLDVVPDDNWKNQSYKVHRRWAEWGDIPEGGGVFSLDQDFWHNMSDQFAMIKSRKPVNLNANSFGGVFHGTTVNVISEVELEAFCGQMAKNYRDVECFPAPDAFNPCEDVMGNMLLRVVVWVVVVTSVLGNLAVMVVLVSTGACSSVSKFLMCNLAFADFCMGTYLFMIAAMDLHSMGTYFNYAIDWQHGYGCQIAGFLTVFATELSIYTLTVISVERWYAIARAVRLDRRLKLRRAVRMLSGGWLFALVMAILPLLGVSDYSRTSICLPMGMRGPADVFYLLLLLTANSAAFLFIFFCYGNMYMSVIRHQSRASANDMAVAKRMALLVITDFLCWAPVAFFAMTAVAGYPLIDVTNSKILLVFFYPLNSCANPFLYAIFTTQYRRDFLGLLRRFDFCKGRLWRGSRKQDTCAVPPLQFCAEFRHWQPTTSTSSTDNSRKVLRASDLSSQQDVLSLGWEDQDIHLWPGPHLRESTSSEDSAQYCKNHSSSSQGTLTHKGSPHPIKHRIIHQDKFEVKGADCALINTTCM